MKILMKNQSQRKGSEHMKKQILVGKSNTETASKNYNKMAALLAVMEGKKAIIMDEGEEYKSIISKLGIKETHK